MTILLLAAAAAAWWFWGRGLTRQQLVAAASALAGAWLLLKGQWQIAMPMFLPGIWMLVRQGRRSPPERMDALAESGRRILADHARSFGGTATTRTT